MGRMGLIPQEVYALVERRRKSRWVMIARAEMALQEAQARAVNISAPAPDAVTVHGGEKDKMPGKVAAILRAEERLEQARKWEEVFRLMDRVFPFESTQEGIVAAYLYDNGMTQKEVCAVFHCSRLAVRQKRDNWVCHAALIAAGEGLIKIDKDL